MVVVDYIFLCEINNFGKRAYSWFDHMVPLHLMGDTITVKKLLGYTGLTVTVKIERNIIPPICANSRADLQL